MSSINAVHKVQQLRIVQHDQRHGVVAVQIGIQTQLGLLADARDQLATGRERLCPDRHFLPRFCRRSRAHEGQIDKAVAYDINIGIASQFIASEIDGDVLFINQNAADKNHRRQIEQINQDEFAPDAPS